MTQLLTNSRMSCFRACPKRHFFRYECGLAPDEDDLALRVGTAYHALHEARDRGLNPEAAWDEITAGCQLDPYDAAMVAAMYTVHQEQHAGDALEVVASEMRFELPLRNPDTGAPTPIWMFAGVIDRIFRLPDGRLAILDYKTTGEDIGPGSDYWLRLSLDQQMSLYVLAARELGHDVQTILYDVARRPMQRPLKATPPENRKLKKDGTPYANIRLEDETPDEFAGRVAEALRAEPGRYFVRHEIARFERDLDEMRAEMWHQQLAIREAQRSGRWFRNPGACVVPYRCPYLGVCQQGWSPQSSVPSGFRIVADVHPELARAEQAAQTASPGQAGQEV